MERIFCASARIAKVMSQEACVGRPGLGPRCRAEGEGLSAVTGGGRAPGLGLIVEPQGLLRSQVACLQLNCDEVVSLVQKLCENIGAMDLQHDKASVAWIDTFLQTRVKELEDKVAELRLGHLGLGLPGAPSL